MVLICAWNTLNLIGLYGSKGWYDSSLSVKNMTLFPFPYHSKWLKFRECIIPSREITPPTCKYQLLFPSHIFNSKQKNLLSQERKFFPSKEAPYENRFFTRETNSFCLIASLWNGGKYSWVFFQGKQLYHFTFAFFSQLGQLIKERFCSLNSISLKL